MGKYLTQMEQPMPKATSVVRAQPGIGLWWVGVLLQGCEFLVSPTQVPWLANLTPVRKQP